VHGETLQDGVLQACLLIRKSHSCEQVSA